MQQPNDYALVIGINSYPFYKNLNGAVADAEAFADWLTDDLIGGGLPKSPSANCQLVLNPAAPIGAEIDDALDKILTAVDLARGNGQQPRRFYLYFSGHGQAKKVDEVNLCLSKWSVKYKPYSALSANECWSAVINCMGFREVVVLLDCCRVRLASAIGMPPNLACPPISTASATRMFKAFSSEFLNQSYEALNRPSPGSPVPQPDDDNETLYSGYFTRALLTALKGAAADRPGGGVSQAALKRYLETEVPRMALADNLIQKPRVPETDLPPDAVFGSALPQGQKKTFPVTIQFLPGRIGNTQVTLVLPDNEELPCPDINQPWVLQLPKGLYLLSDRGCNPLYEKSFRVPDVQNVTF